MFTSCLKTNAKFKKVGTPTQRKIMSQNTPPVEPAVEAPKVDAIFKEVGIEDNKAKVSMTAMLVELNKLVGKPFTKDALKTIAHQFAVRSARSATGKPREATKLFTKDGELLGARCSATMVWMLAEEFTPMQSVSKQGHSLKGALNTKARGIESEANSLLADARSAATPAEKLEFFEKYDAEMAKAKDVRATALSADDLAEGTLTFDSIEELAKHLKVEVISTRETENTGKEDAE